MTREVWDEWRGELYGLLLALTDGDAKEILRNMMEAGGPEAVDGFKALLVVKKRFDVQTGSILLQAYSEDSFAPDSSDQG